MLISFWKVECSLNMNIDLDNSSGERSRVGVFFKKDLIPFKIGMQLQMNSSLSSSEPANIVNLQNQAILNERDIKTPKSITIYNLITDKILRPSNLEIFNRISKAAIKNQLD